MWHVIFFILIFSFQSSLSIAQQDTLSVFRSNPTNSLNKSRSNTTFKNSLSLTLNHLGRGGATLVYERLLSNPNFAIYGGYGISVTDYIGRFSFDDNLEFYNPSDYSSESVKNTGRIIELGAKFMELTVWDDLYFAVGYSYLSNHLKRTIDYEYTVVNNGPRVYNLDYSSNEVKFVLGFTNDPQKRLYFDGQIGPGFRLINAQKISITDDPFVLYNLVPQPDVRQIEVKKENEFNLKFWLFIGFKIGIRL